MSAFVNEQDVRALVREAIERHLGRPDEKRGEKRYREPFSPDHSEKGSRYLFSHTLLKVLPGSQVDEGMCVIEPAVRCNHCGFCQSYGH